MIHSLLLAGSLVALGDAGLRLASRLAPRGLERFVGWTVLVAAAAVIEALGLGLLALGGSSAALSAAALITWLAARRWLPAPETPVRRELPDWWGGLSIGARAGVGAVAGAAVALALTILHRPAPGYDGITYHLPEVVGFVQSGHPGAVLQFYYGLPVGNYPLTNEVLTAWMTGLSRGFAALTLWSPASALLLAAAGWLALRELRVPATFRCLALGALLLGPLILAAMGQPGTDLPALTWLVCCVALCLAARERPLLLCPAIIGFGLATGTKTTVVLLGLVALAWALWGLRRSLRAIRGPLLLAAAAAALVGTPWYVRNLIDHGSPLWPFLSLPWGDPVPPLLKVLSKTMASRLQYTLFDNLQAYLTATAGLVVLLVGGVVVPLLSRRRRPVLGAAVVALGAVVWANSPLTGLPDGDFLAGAVGSTVRYLMAVFAAGAGALALSATDGPFWARLLAAAALAGALVWGLVRDIQHGFFLPFSTWLVPGLLAGALLGLVAAPALAGAWSLLISPGSRGRSRRWPGASTVLTGLVVALAAALVLAKGSAGFLGRHAAVSSEWDQQVIAYLYSRPGFDSSHAVVASTPVAIGLVVGDELQHRISLIGEHEPCGQVRARARVGWVVVRVVGAVPVPGHPGLVFGAPGSAQACLAGETPAFQTAYFRIYGPSTLTGP
ncbi:MAG: hypothetical protein M3Z06_01045 [Actinomycetota bacterium]|nr:hypothetical protein [Actinomycetota bacterium]